MYYLCALLILKNKIMNGCIYFFKHIDLPYVLIGTTNENNPKQSFEEFKHFSPGGGEFLDFIVADDVKLTLQVVKTRLKSKKFDNSWFNLTTQEVVDLCLFYNSQEEIKKRNNFLIEYSNKRKIENTFIFAELFNKLEKNKKYFNEDFFKQAFAINSEVSTKAVKRELLEYCKENHLEYKTKTFNNRRYFIVN